MESPKDNRKKEMLIAAAVAAVQTVTITDKVTTVGSVTGGPQR